MEICLLKYTPDSMGKMRGTGLDLVGSPPSKSNSTPPLVLVAHHAGRAALGQFLDEVA